jgi:hypothetical protein
MNHALMISCRQFRCVDNLSSWRSYPWIAISLCIAQQVGESSFARQSGEGVALQSSMPNGAAPAYPFAHGHSGDLRRS